MDSHYQKKENGLLETNNLISLKLVRPRVIYLFYFYSRSVYLVGKDWAEMRLISNLWRLQRLEAARESDVNPLCSCSNLAFHAEFIKTQTASRPQLCALFPQLEPKTKTTDASGSSENKLLQFFFQHDLFFYWLNKQKTPNETGSRNHQVREPSRTPACGSPDRNLPDGAFTVNGFQYGHVPVISESSLAEMTRESFIHFFLSVCVFVCSLGFISSRPRGAKLRLCFCGDGAFTDRRLSESAALTGPDLGRLKRGWPIRRSGPVSPPGGAASSSAVPSSLPL